MNYLNWYRGKLNLFVLNKDIKLIYGGIYKVSSNKSFIFMEKEYGR